MSVAPGITLRDAASDDIPEITRIYAHHVLRGLASFEDVPPDEEEIRRRHAAVAGRGLPWLVACEAGAVRGYAYAGPYRHRSCYRYTLEDSIYVAPASMRRGMGLALLNELVARCTDAGYRQMVAVIGDSANEASIGLHERLGFRRVGLLPATGLKFSRWVDTVLMQRELGAGAKTLP